MNVELVVNQEYVIGDKHADFNHYNAAVGKIGKLVSMKRSYWSRSGYVYHVSVPGWAGLWEIESEDLLPITNHTATGILRSDYS